MDDTAVVTIHSTPAGPTVQVAVPSNPTPSVIREACDVAIETYKQALLIEQSVCQVTATLAHPGS